MISGKKIQALATEKFRQKLALSKYEPWRNCTNLMHLFKIALSILNRGAEAHFLSWLNFSQQSWDKIFLKKVLLRLDEISLDKTCQSYWGGKGSKLLRSKGSESKLYKTNRNLLTLRSCPSSLWSRLGSFWSHFSSLYKTFWLLGLVSASEGLILSWSRLFLDLAKKIPLLRQ